MHSDASDGNLSASELVDLALKKGLEAIAITDHDSVGSVALAIKHASDKNIEIIPGIEINCDASEVEFKEVEAVGLFIDYKNAAMAKFVKEAKEERLEQKKKIVKKLQELGFDITFEELKPLAKGSLGRPHIAQLLIQKAPGKFLSIKDVFDKYLGVGMPAYVEREKKYTLKQAISLIKKCGGLAFLAHPGAYGKDPAKLIDFFQKQGGHGIETYYPYHLICPELKIDEEENLRLIESFQEIAKNHKLLESGGSDFHGGGRQTINSVKIPYEVLDKLKKVHLKI
jgi:predicted metal-dependent phosphoesterase TrpH